MLNRCEHNKIPEMCSYCNKIMPQDIKYFRRVKHGVESINAYCRNCKYTYHGKNNSEPVNHAKKTAHTVDMYTETHLELTSYYKNI